MPGTGLAVSDGRRQRNMTNEITVTIQWITDGRHNDTSCLVAQNAYNFCPACGKTSPAYGYLDGDARGATTKSLWESDLLCPHCKDRHEPMALYPCPLFRVDGPLFV
jgi:hypothetical protein